MVNKRWLHQQIKAVSAPGRLLLLTIPQKEIEIVS
jgi:hypothetical protein